MCFQARSSCFPAKRSFQIHSHVLLELQLGSFLSATCHGLQHSVSFRSCCFTVRIWSWLWDSAILCPHHLLVGSAGKWGLPPCHAQSGVMQVIHKDVMLYYVMFCYVMLRHKQNAVAICAELHPAVVWCHAWQTAGLPKYLVNTWQSTKISYCLTTASYPPFIGSVPAMNKCNISGNYHFWEFFLLHSSTLSDFAS